MKSMYSIVHILLVLVSLSSPEKLVSQDFSPIDNLIEQWIQNDYYPGASVIIVKNDSVVLNKNYGTYTSETEVYIASAGKWLAAAAIAAVVDKTELNWSDPIGKWLPEFKGSSMDKIELRQLLSHTSGIPKKLLQNKDTFNSLQKSVLEILTLDTVFKPGSRFEYGGESMQVAGRMAEVAAGMDFETLFQTMIAKPLDMKNTHFTPVSTVQGHNPMLGGGARTTITDYIKFLKMIYHNGMIDGKQVISVASINEMQADQVGNAKVAKGEFVERALGLTHKGIYGLGEWREKIDAAGNAYQISSPGWAGAYPWINKHDGVYGVFLSHVVGTAAKEAGFSTFIDTAIISKLTSEIIQSKATK